MGMKMKFWENFAFALAMIGGLCGAICGLMPAHVPTSRSPAPSADSIVIELQKTADSGRKVDSAINVLDARRAKLQRDRKRLDSMESVLYGRLKKLAPAAQNRQAAPGERLPMKR